VHRPGVGVKDSGLAVGIQRSATDPANNTSQFSACQQVVEMTPSDRPQVFGILSLIQALPNTAEYATPPISRVMQPRGEIDLLFANSDKDFRPNIVPRVGTAHAVRHNSSIDLAAERWILQASLDSIRGYRW
jgi:hypothetical protein